MTSARWALFAVALLLSGCTNTPAPGDETSDTAGDVVRVPGVALDGDSAALSPDGSRLAVPCDGSICVWTTADGVLADTVDGGVVVAWSPDGTTLATDRSAGGEVSLVLLDAQTGQERAMAPAYEYEVVQDALGDRLLDIAFSPDGSRVAAAGADGVVRLWSSADPDEVADMEAAGERPVAVDFAPDGAQLAVAYADAPTSIVDVATGDAVGTLGEDPQGDVVWSPDGTVLATASFALDDAAATTVWDAASGEAKATLPRPGSHLAFDGEDSVVLSEKNQPDVLVWTWAGDGVRELKGAKDNPRAVLVSPDEESIFAVSPRDGVLEWAGDAAVRTYELPARD